MSTYYGTVKGNMVILPEGTQLAEGAAVEVRVLQQPGQSPATEADFKQRLIDLGLLGHSKMTVSVIPPQNRTPIEVEGQPLSQTIIEEQ